MTELLRPSGAMGEPYPPCSMMDRCRISVVYPGNGELRHSKSDDLILQSNSPEPTESPVADPRAQVWATLDRPTASAATRASAALSAEAPCYYSDSETDEAQAEKSAKKELSCDLQRLAAATAAAAARQQRIGLYDRVDPEDSIRDLVSENDFYRFVLFKRHYDKYIHLSAKYEEARNIAYYLEEKYHEVKAERDELVGSKQQLERRLEAKHVELHDKEEELFLQLELVVRLDDDRDKLREELERVRGRADDLQKQLSQAHKELEEHAEQAKQARRRLERARLEALGHVAAERQRRDALEQDNERLRSEYTTSGRQQQIAELKWLAHQSATLTSQLHKGVRHLASCTRKKCSVCTYTRNTFGDMAGSSSGHRRRKATSAVTGCLGWMRPSGTPHSSYFRESSSRSESPSRQQIPPAPPPPQLTSVPSHSSLGALSLAYVAYIDEDVDTEDGDTASSAASSGAPRAFSSDSGFSSELYDSRCQGSTSTGGAASSSSAEGSRPSGLHRSRWSSSFRRLIHRVSKRSSP